MALTTHPPVWIMSLNRLFFFLRLPLSRLIWMYLFTYLVWNTDVLAYSLLECYVVTWQQAFFCYSVWISFIFLSLINFDKLSFKTQSIKLKTKLLFWLPIKDIIKCTSRVNFHFSFVHQINYRWHCYTLWMKMFL